MNPIEFLMQNGYNPDNFRTPTPQGSAPRDCQTKYYHSVPQVRRRTPVYSLTPIRRQSVVKLRNNIINQWFATGNKDITGIFVPYLMLDVFQIVSSEHLSKVDFRGKERKHYTCLMNAYHRFNSLFLPSAKPKRT